MMLLQKTVPTFQRKSCRYSLLRSLCIANKLSDSEWVVLQMLDYNVPGGKLNRGLAVGDILLHLTKDVSTSPNFI